MKSVRNRARSLRAGRSARVLMSAACTSLMISQSACPLVNLLARWAPTPEMLAAMESGPMGEGCAPCEAAGTGDCLEQIMRWLEAQLRGDPTVPFPDAECVE